MMNILIIFVMVNSQLFCCSWIYNSIDVSIYYSDIIFKGRLILKEQFSTNYFGIEKNTAGIYEVKTEKIIKGVPPKILIRNELMDLYDMTNSAYIFIIDEYKWEDRHIKSGVLIYPIYQKQLLTNVFISNLKVITNEIVLYNYIFHKMKEYKSKVPRFIDYSLSGIEYKYLFKCDCGGCGDNTLKMDEKYDAQQAGGAEK